MANISKKLFLALSLVCVIAIITFLIQLIIINSGVEPRQPNTTISGDNPPNRDNENSGSGEDSGENGDGGNSEDNGTAPPTTRPPPQGQRNEVLVDTDKILVLYTRTELFDLIPNEFDWVFSYTGGGIAGLSISFTFVSPQNAAADAEDFLNRHTSGIGADYKGDLFILDTTIRGYHVTTSVGGVTYEAWLHQMAGSDLALAFVLNYSNNEQRDALYEVLNTISFETITS